MLNNARVHRSSAAQIQMAEMKSTKEEQSPTAIQEIMKKY